MAPLFYAQGRAQLALDVVDLVVALVEHAGDSHLDRHQKRAHEGFTPQEHPSDEETAEKQHQQPGRKAVQTQAPSREGTEYA